MAEPSLSNLLQAAIQDVKQGNMKAAKTALSQVISAEPDSFYAEKAWIWMSATVVDPEQKRVCLENALKINPENVTAQKGLAKLPPPPTTPDEEEFEAPEWIAETNFETENINTVPSPQISQPISNQEQKVLPPRKSDQQLIDEYVALQTVKGWQIINRTETSVQLRKPKRWSNLLLILGLLLLCAYVVPGLIVLLIALIDYLSQKEEVKFINVKELRATTDLTENPLKTTSDNHSLNLKVVTVIIIMGFLAVFLFIGIINLSNGPTNNNQMGSSSSYSVTYRVIGAENRAIVMSGKSANNQPITVQLPWQYTTSMKYGDTAALITNGETNQTVRCEIWVDGQLQTSATSSAAMDNMAACGYIVGRNVVINVRP